MFVALLKIAIVDLFMILLLLVLLFDVLLLFEKFTVRGEYCFEVDW